MLERSGIPFGTLLARTSFFERFHGNGPRSDPRSDIVEEPGGFQPRSRPRRSDRPPNLKQPQTTPTIPRLNVETRGRAPAGRHGHCPSLPSQRPQWQKMRKWWSLLVLMSASYLVVASVAAEVTVCEMASLQICAICSHLLVDHV